MGEVECMRCGKFFRYKCHLARHHERKTLCAKKVPTGRRNECACRHCGLIFSSRQGAYRHEQKNCPAKAEQETEVLQEMADLRLELADLRNMLSKKSAAGGSVVVHNKIGCTIDASTTNVINVNVFGNEDLKHIGPSEIKALLDGVLMLTTDPERGAIQALTEATMMICSDPKRPINLTCYVPNKKHNAVRVRDADGGWVLRPFMSVKTPLIARAAGLLFDNQPFEDAAKYGDIMKALRAEEQKKSATDSDKCVRGILERNKELVTQAFGHVP
jgi:hypothetical protein